MDATGPAPQPKLSPLGAKPRRETRQVRLILVESGSTGLAAHAVGDDSEQTLTLVQGHGEHATAFASRVFRRILILAGGGRSIERTFLLLGPRFDAEARLARLVIARALIRHAATSPDETAELVFSASGERSELTRWLPDLVDTIIGEPGSAAVTIAINSSAASP